jgi:hypothetical protein
MEATGIEEEKEEEEKGNIAVSRMNKYEIYFEIF